MIEGGAVATVSYASSALLATYRRGIILGSSACTRIRGGARRQARVVRGRAVRMNTWSAPVSGAHGRRRRRNASLDGRLHSLAATASPSPIARDGAGNCVSGGRTPALYLRDPAVRHLHEAGRRLGHVTRRYHAGGGTRRIGHPPLQEQPRQRRPFQLHEGDWRAVVIGRLLRRKLRARPHCSAHCGIRSGIPISLLEGDVACHVRRPLRR